MLSAKVIDDLQTPSVATSTGSLAIHDLQNTTETIITTSSQAVMSSSSMGSPELSQDPYRDPRPLVGCSTHPVIYRYPYAPFPTDHAPVVPNLLDTLRKGTRNSEVKQIFFKHKKRWFVKILLSKQSQWIDFKIVMCGPNPGSAEPSIIATCPKKILNMLKKELQAYHMQLQYAKGVTKSQVFNIYFCADDSERYSPLAKRSAVSLSQFESARSLCGTRIHVRQKKRTRYPTTAFKIYSYIKVLKEEARSKPLSTAKVSCLLDINDDLYALAPAHIFNIEDEDEDQREAAGAQTTLRKATRSSAANTNIPYLRHLDTVLPGPNDIPDNNNIDADWAATRIKLPTHCLPNMYWDGTTELRYIESDASESMILEAWSTGPRPVYIINSPFSVKKGQLLPGLANIFGPSGRGSCNVLIVSMDNNGPRNGK